MVKTNDKNQLFVNLNEIKTFVKCIFNFTFNHQ